MDLIIIAILVGPAVAGAIVWAVFMILRKAKVIKPYQPPQPAEGSEPAPKPVTCPFCKTVNQGGAVKCVSCGFDFRD